MQTLALTRGSDTHVDRPWLVDLLLAVLMGFVAALAKRHLDWSLGIPGHAGVGWIAVLTAGVLINPRRGMAVVAGASMAVWAVPMGIGHSFGYNVFLYGSAAAVLDLLGVLRVPIHRWWGAAIAGGVAHVVKYGYIFMSAWVSGIVRNFEVFGILAAFRNHVVFGIAGGLLGWAVVGVGRRTVWARRFCRDAS